ncbi:S1 family peptidase [Pseudanabaena sp. PCC 6802]|uniref:S1 family peptidase n=1 Tax=Pseudanabaena sp. PCC 6802 TaxID=118173 RepID=UPI00034CD202|nr:serine protease [Pseudanabaena sp. PCC 6802]
MGFAIAPPAISLPTSTPISQVKPDDRHLSEAQLKSLARSITVKVKVDRAWGSGILVRKRGATYFAVTNQHVVAYSDRLSIQTMDGRIYPAKARRIEFGDSDLALLEFQAKSNYTIAPLGQTYNVKVGDEVFAAGFPSETEHTDRIENIPTRGQTSNLAGFNFVPGRISLLTPKVIAGGYQIGYTNDIRKGMSGGPLLNRQGQVIGINGMHAYPIWGDPFVFTDGSRPERSQHEIMMRLSWAIPIETFIAVFKSERSVGLGAAPPRRSGTPLPPNKHLVFGLI